DAFVDHLTVVVAVDDVLGLMDGELREAVDRDVRKELQDIGPFEATLPEERPVADVARLLRGHALVDPVRVLGQAPPNREVARWRGPHLTGREGHFKPPGWISRLQRRATGRRVPLPCGS